MGGEDELRRWLQEKLPDYMVPAVFVRLDALPLTPTGKVDRRGLPAPHWTRSDGAGVYQAPRGDVERAIAAIWQDVLGLEQVGTHDNFFDLGGHSLLMARVHGRLRETYPTLALVDLFRYPTIHALAKHLSAPGDTRAADAQQAAQAIQERAQKQRAAQQRRKQQAQQLRERERTRG
jgi:catechol 2,3-dioxygenase-like lactoylglutathione lyase family enzyme